MEENFVFVGRERISEDLRWKVLKRDGYRCRYCGKDSGPFHMDHVYPVVKGGETTINNLVTACDKCNMKKHATVGIYPCPIGYFEEQSTEGIRLAAAVAFGVVSIINGYYFADEGFEIFGIASFILGLIVSAYCAVKLAKLRIND